MMPTLEPHHDGSDLYVSNLAPSLGDTVSVRLRVPADYPELDAVLVRTDHDHEPGWAEAVQLGTVDGWTWWQADVRVHNPYNRYRWLIRPTSGPALWLNQAGLSKIEVADRDDFVLLATPPAPEWLANSVMYQIFPDRFARSAQADQHPTPEWAIPAKWDDPVDPVMPGRSQQFYGGDLDGIIEHLDHLESLGVTLIYLTPIFPGQSNHRYDAASFQHVDPLLGGDAAYQRLIEAAHARGMKVMGDLTTNHSGVSHEWFQAAYGNPDAPESDFYYFTNDEHTEYECWLGTPTLPKFNWASEGLRKRFIQGRDSVVAKWLLPPYEADGWRIDVANMTGRLGAIDLNAEVRQLLAETMREINPDTALLGEITNDASGDLTGDAWHGAMTYLPFTRPLWGWLQRQDAPGFTEGNGTKNPHPWFFGHPINGYPQYTAADFAEANRKHTATFPWRIRLGNMQALDTHDTGRFATNAKPGTIPVAVGLTMTMPGVPVLFAGDEFGAVGEDGEASRTPIPWGSETDPAIAQRLALYRDLIALRHAHPVLRTGGIRWLHVDDEVIVFVRESADEAVLVFAASATSTVTLSADAVAGLDSASRGFGEVDLRLTSDGAQLVSDGPAFAAWVLPGVRVPVAG